MIIENSKWLSENIDTILCGLLMECPLGGNPEHCKLKDMRNRSYRESVNDIIGLPKTEKSKMYNHHTFCFLKNNNN